MSRRELRIEVSDLLKHPGERRRQTGQHRFADLELSTARVPRDAAVSFDLILESLTDGVVVAGSVSAPWVGECRRCLEDMSGTLVEEVREVFSERAIEGETYPLDGQAIDLAPMLREVVLLGLPMAPVCDLGPACPNLREATDVTFGSSESAELEDRGVDQRWAALDELRFDSDSSDE